MIRNAPDRGALYVAQNSVQSAVEGQESIGFVVTYNGAILSWEYSKDHEILYKCYGREVYVYKDASGYIGAIITANVAEAVHAHADQIM